MGHHGQHFSRGDFRHYDSAAVNAHFGIGCLLKPHIQRGIYIVPGIFHSCQIVCHLIVQGSICINQIVIRKSFHAHTSLCGISYHMGKKIPVRIASCFVLLAVQNGFRQYFPVLGKNGSPVIPGQQYLLSGIIAVINHLLLTGCREISQIHD